MRPPRFAIGRRPVLRNRAICILLRPALLCCLPCVLLLFGSATADDSPSKSLSKPKPPADPVVVAHVSSEPIYAGEVNATLARLLANRKIPAKQVPRVQAEMLAQLVDQRLALAYLARHKRAVSRHHVDAAIENMKALLKTRKTTLEVHLARREITEAALRAELSWRMSWRQYLARRITDDVLKKHFETHRKHFDGTRVRVSQIRFVPKNPKDPGEVETLTEAAANVRRQIVGGEIRFADAVAQFSQAPSKENGGDQGFITRHGEMSEPFATAAFKLDKDEISPPVVTRFGVHLILCTDIEPGKKTWEDAKSALSREVIRRGFRRIVNREREQTKVEFTGALPYIKPATGELVLPKRD